MKLLNKSIPIQLVLLISLAFLHNGFIAFSDSASTWFNPVYKLKEIFYSWNSLHLAGFYVANNSTNIFISLFYSLVSFITDRPDLLQKISWIVFFDINGILLYIKLNKFIRSRYLTVLCVLFILFNPLSQYFLWGIQHWTYYLTVPYILGTLEYIDYLQDKMFKHLIFISLIWFVFGFVFAQPAFFASFPVIICPFFLYGLFRCTNRRKYITDHLLFGIYFIIINLVYLFPLLRGGNEIITNQISAYSANNILPILSDLKEVNFLWSFINITLGYGKFFRTDLFFLVLWTGFISFILYFGFTAGVKKSNKNLNYKIIFILSSLIILFVFLIKGLSPPFSGLSWLIYNHKIMYIFRAFKEKFAIGFITSLSLLCAYLLPEKNKLFRSLFFILTVYSYFLFITGAWLPEGYKSANTFDYFRNINITQLPVSRVLNLPLVNYSFFYTVEPSYQGDNPIRDIFGKDTIFSAYGQDNATRQIKNMTDTDTLKPDIFKDYLQKYNIEYILSNKNSYVAQDDNPYAYKPQILDRYSFLMKTTDNKYFDLYRFNNFYTRIYGQDLVYYKVNPSKYEILIKNLTAERQIQFLETFHTGWKIYPEKYNQNFNCSVKFTSFDNQTTECSGNEKFFTFGDIIKIFKKPLPESLHSSIYDYANVWNISLKDISDNYSREYYQKNPDGSINILLSVYFEPQANYYLGLAISLPVFILTLPVIFINRRSQKK